MNPETSKQKPARQRGFTLIELLVVVTIIGILAGIAVSNVKWAQQRARESALRHDLFEMRKAIDDYYADKQKYPDSLQTLKSEHYLRNIPKDPISMHDDWEEVQAQVDPSGGSADPTAMPVDPTALGTSGVPGIADVKSKAPGNGLDGTPYNSW
jgi:general secretion pathway protein G